LFTIFGHTAEVKYPFRTGGVNHQLKVHLVRNGVISVLQLPIFINCLKHNLYRGLIYVALSSIYAKKISRPLIIAALPVKHVRDIEKMHEVSNIVDLVELRVDYMEDPLALNYESLEKEKVLITLRDADEGGFIKHPDEIKLRLLKYLNELGMLYDVEMRFVEKYNNKVNYEDKIVSYHVFNSSQLLDLSTLRAKAREYLDKVLIFKVATVTFPGYRSYLTSILELGDNVAVMPMSPSAKERIAFAFLGSKMLFCCIDTPTAQGQIRCNHVKEILNTIDKYDKIN